MAGKKTYLHPSPGGHRDLEVALVEPLRRQIDWQTVESALGRPLEDHERLLVADVVEREAHYRRMVRAAKPSAQDVKETLSGIAKMGDAEVRAELARADGWTQAEVFTALWRSGARDDAALFDPKPEQIRAAAAARIDKVPSRPGRRSDTAPLALAILGLWRALGGAEYRPHVSDDYSSPLVDFAAALYEAAGVPGGKAAVAARLRQALGS